MSAPSLKRPFSNKVYYVCWSEGRRSHRVSTRTTDLAAAKAFLGQWLLMEHQDPSLAQERTCAEIWQVYRAKHVELKCASHATFDYAWQNLSQVFGSKLLRQIDQDLVDEYERKRTKGVIGRPSKGSTIRRELVCLKACFNWAASPRRKLISHADVPYFDVPANGAPRDRWLRPDEVKALFAAAERLNKRSCLSREQLFLWLGLETGARKTAILELTWDRVDFDIGVVHYNVPGRARTKKRRGSVAISPTLRPVLERAYRERRGDTVIAGKDNIWRALQTVAKEAGVKGLSPHVLRHTAATTMARNGVPLHKVAGVLSNSIQMVDRVYAHHSPESSRDAVAQISGPPTVNEDQKLLEAIRSGRFKLVEVIND